MEMKMPAVFSQIEADLKRILDQPEGLHFAVCLPARADGSPQFSGPNPRYVNKEALKTTIRIYGLEQCLALQTGNAAFTAAELLDNAALEQVRLWEAGIPEVDRSFHRMQKAATQRYGRPISLKRLVLDVEVGGVLYAAVEGYGWIFAATLNQQAMNKGKAEQQLTSIADMVRTSEIAGLAGGATA
jgi:hypothetical protein